MLELILADQLVDLPPKDCHLVVKNGNFTCLSTVRVHIGRSTGRYIFYISTSGHSCNDDTAWLNISDTAVHHMFLRKMEKPADLLYDESKDTYRVMEASIQPDLPPTIVSKISTVSCDNT